MQRHRVCNERQLWGDLIQASTDRSWPLWKAFHNVESLLPGDRGPRVIIDAVALSRDR
jgi:hypothetical protein